MRVADGGVGLRGEGQEVKGEGGKKRWGWEGSCGPAGYGHKHQALLTGLRTPIHVNKTHPHPVETETALPHPLHFQLLAFDRWEPLVNRTRRNVQSRKISPFGRSSFFKKSTRQKVFLHKLVR